MGWALGPTWKHAGRGGRGHRDGDPHAPAAAVLPAAAPAPPAAATAAGGTQAATREDKGHRDEPALPQA